MSANAARVWLAGDRDNSPGYQLLTRSTHIRDHDLASFFMLFYAYETRSHVPIHMI